MSDLLDEIESAKKRGIYLNNMFWDGERKRYQVNFRNASGGLPFGFGKSIEVAVDRALMKAEEEDLI